MFMCLSGCATAIPYSSKEKCALDDMKVVGVDLGNSSAAAYNLQTRAMVVGRGSGTTVRCEVPSTDAEKAEIEAINQYLEPINAYNSGIGGKRVLTGVGYVFWILPGLGAKLYYDSQYDKAIKDAEAIMRAPAAAPTQLTP